MTSPGGTGMDSGDDYVAARLSIDIPTEGVQGVREITEAVDRFRTSMEQATRAGADMTTYVTSMGEAARKTTEFQAGLVAQLTQMVSLQGHMGGNAAANYLVPGGFTQPFQGQTGGLGAAPGMRVPNPTDVTYQLQQHQQNSPREYRNMVAARGGVDTTGGVNLTGSTIQNLSSQIAGREHAAAVQDHQTGSGAQPAHSPSGGRESTPYPFDKARAKTQAVTGFAGQVMGELGAHDGIPFLPLAQKGLDAARDYRSKRRDQSAAQNKDEEGASKAPGTDGSDESAPGGGIDKVLGGAGSALAAVGAVFGLVQSGGQMVQGWRNIASVRGGNAGEGLEASFKARMMASNPYLTTAQTRQMMQAGMSEGYLDASGNPMGNGGEAMDFMSNNLQKYDMDPSQSVDMLRMAAKGTTISVSELAQSLDTLKKVVAGGGPLSQSFPDIANNLTQGIKSLEAQGVAPGAAMQQAMTQAVSFNGDPLLQGTMSQTMPNATGTALEAQYGGRGGTPMGLPPGLDPRGMNRWINDSDPTGASKYNAIIKLVNMAKAVPPGDTPGSGPPPDGPNALGYVNSRVAFQGFMQQNFPNSPEAQDPQKSDALYEKFAFTGMTGEKQAAADKKTLDDQTKGDRTTQQGYDGGVNLPGIGNIGGKQIYGSAALKRITDAYGGGEKGMSQIEVSDGKGKWTKFDPTNKDMVDKLNNDQINWRHVGDKGKGMTVEQTYALGGDMDSDFSTDHPNDPAGFKKKDDKNANANNALQGKVTLDLTDQAKQLLKVQGDNPIQLTPTQKGANAGDGTSQVNNPSFFDQILTSKW